MKNQAIWPASILLLALSGCGGEGVNLGNGGDGTVNLPTDGDPGDGDTGGGDTGGGDTGGGDTGGGDDGSTPDIDLSALNLSLLDCEVWDSQSKDTSQCVDAFSVSLGEPAIVLAQLLDENGQPQVRQKISFNLEGGNGTLSGNGLALTDANGLASIRLSAPEENVDDVLVDTVKASFSSVDGDSLESSLHYEVGATNLTLQLSADSLLLPSGSSTLLNISVLKDAEPYLAPVNISISSPCQLTGKAGLAANVTSLNGVASTTYKNQGCAGDDRITVSALSTSATVTIDNEAALASSISFVSAEPEVIVIKDSSGPSSSLLTFQVKDSNGQPYQGETVYFEAIPNINSGSLTEALSDENGNVTVQVNSGNVPGALRIKAWFSPDGGTTEISQFSNQLAIHTGLPEQQHFALAADVLNPEAWGIVNESVEITATFADGNSNPVADGTAVYFMAEAGKIDGSCLTVNGECNVTWYSQAGSGRPNDGRVTIMAATPGVDSFQDTSGTGEFISIAQNWSKQLSCGGYLEDLPEPFLNSNESYEQCSYFDLDTQQTVSVWLPTYSGHERIRNVDAYDTPDGWDDRNGVYNGPQCNDLGNDCSPDLIEIWQDLTIVMASSTPMIEVYQGARQLTPGELLDISSTGNTSIGLTVVVYDALSSPGIGAPVEAVYGVGVKNPAPLGTSVGVTTTNGALSGELSYTVGNKGIGADAFSFILEREATANGKPDGILTIRAVTPKGSPVSFTLSVRDDG